MAAGTTLLLVTWFYLNQPPTSYQAAFATPQACDIARAQLYAEVVRIRQEAEAAPRVRSMPDGGYEISGPPAVPTLSAVCVSQ
jgi:hypothetical protein